MDKIYYRSLNSYFRETYHEKIYKISLNAGLSCPNRDGNLGTRGCIFCSLGGSGEFASSSALSISAQIDDAIKRISAKMPRFEDNHYWAYFQAFTNTYGPVDYLRAIYYEAIKDERIAGLSIATRPDCINEEVYSLLSEINRIKPVWIELGLQTTKKESIEYIRRGYDTEIYDEAVRRLKDLNINVITHVILGLPGETEEDMLNTVRHVAATNTFGIKLQLLHVLKGTDLAKDYLNGNFRVMSLEEYIDIVIKCLAVLPEDMVIHRLTGDGDKKILIAPLWSADKKKVLNAFSKYIEAK